MSYVDLPVLEKPSSLRHSFSRIDTFSSICELRYAFDAIMPRQPASLAMRRGTQVHDIAEKAAKKVAERAFTVPDALVESAAEIEGPLNEEKLQPYLTRLEQFLSSVRPIRGGIEMWVRDLEWDGQKASELLELPWCGKVDLLAKPKDAHVTVFDYKTIGNWSRRKNEAEARKSIQLKSYCLATGRERAGFVYLNPNFDLEVVEVEFTEEELEHGFNTLIHLCKTAEHRWKNGGWNITTNNALCSPKWCDWHKHCQGCAKDPEGVLHDAE